MHWKNRGFSLVELAVVLTISGLILAISAPGLFRYLDGARVRDAANTLREEMRLARQKAVTNNTRNYVYTQLGGSGTQYMTGVQTQTSPGVWSGITWRGPIDLPSKTKQINASFNTSYLYIFYDPSGKPCVNPSAPVRASGSVRVCSTQASVTDTTTINVDLSGSVW